MKIKANKECMCPVCESTSVTYHESDIDGETLYYKCECDECGTTWEENYNLVFAGVSNVIDNDGNEYEVE